MALLNKVLNIPIYQEDVDFVIPDVDDDRRLGIDPFLLYRDSRPDFREAHGLLVCYFREVLESIKGGDLLRAQQLLICPEPQEIGLGYSLHGTKGSDIGPELAREIVQTFSISPALLARGLRHVEELQLISPGVGPDRISDMTANVLKLFLVSYTQEQCGAWNIPVAKAVPLSHYFDFESMSWRDGYFDLPLNPSTGGPLLLVPRRILRILPWINYDDYLGEYKRVFLRPVTRRGSLKLKPRAGTAKKPEKEAPPPPKPQICQVTVQNTAALDSYVDRKEREAQKAEPTELAPFKDQALVKEHAERLISELAAVNPGKEDAYEYQDVVHRILTFCLHPHLVDGKPQERTYGGTLIRDLIFTNEGTRNFWRYLMTEHAGLLIVFELKNKEDITPGDIDQIGTYLGDTMGRLGVLVSRQNRGTTSLNRRRAIFNKESSRKIILHFTDADLLELLKLRGASADTTDYVQQMYRRFMVSIE